MPRNSTQYALAGPVTFRRASRKILGTYGTNLQNIEKSMRALYIPDGFTKELESKCKFWLETNDLSIFTEEELFKLRVMLQVDQAGAEALIVAYDCTAGDYRLLFENNVKPHVYVALKLFKDIWPKKAKELSGMDIDIDLLDKTPIPLLKKNPDWKELDKIIKDSDNWQISERYYYLAKQTCHSANYDIQWAKFIMNILEKSGGKIVLDREQGMHFLNTYRALFPEIPARCERVRRQVDQTKMLFNLHGHPYIITNYNILENTYKEFYAWSPQSTVGEITRIAFCQLQEYIESENKKWDVLADTHDSYLVQCPLTDVQDCSKKMQEFMNQELISPVDGTKFRMRSECQYGFNWSNNSEYNPLGLRPLNF